ncbi:hypothetical protein NDU88_003692 [Pleurodeles waltl]|uniref:Uncharacterized protein n=1 Tax=Pleurodeles waltl TaxID=8319 RepID=A0AAV7UDD5_PLEWA|nr:hypothetical protein NDU88_003692 [Pleurodeles waltl]
MKAQKWKELRSHGFSYGDRHLAEGNYVGKSSSDMTGCQPNLLDCDLSRWAAGQKLVQLAAVTVVTASLLCLQARNCSVDSPQMYIVPRHALPRRLSSSHVGLSQMKGMAERLAREHRVTYSISQSGSEKEQRAQD